jgi:hypothetical protein
LNRCTLGIDPERVAFRRERIIVPLFEQLMACGISDGHNRGMLQLPFGTNRIKLRLYVFSRPDGFQAFLPADLSFDNGR